ncbi:MAG: uroporphyrinogen-III C-methyltransferase [Acetobacteraceae bacterium]|nr:uroporphyrinogen-III C-methyltransferase [Acetobacteraceae bacterium]
MRGGSAGKVYLVGAGPGEVDLLTIRAHRLLTEADVVVHDRLVEPEVLALARSDAELIFVGKARANHCTPQTEINQLLVRLGRSGRTVVRLKGGDPFVFGRGGEEAAALEAAGIPYEVVPGVTAALACAAQARIPLTRRGVARGVVLVTGHTSDGKLDWDFAALARPGMTIAVYMGIAKLAELCAGLMALGRAGKTPAALIERGGTQRHRILHSRLDRLAADGAEWCRSGPVLVLIGEVVGCGNDQAAALEPDVEMA